NQSTSSTARCHLLRHILAVIQRPQAEEPYAKRCRPHHLSMLPHLTQFPSHSERKHVLNERQGRKIRTRIVNVSPPLVPVISQHPSDENSIRTGIVAVRAQGWRLRIKAVSRHP